MRPALQACTRAAASSLPTTTAKRSIPKCLSQRAQTIVSSSTQSQAPSQRTTRRHYSDNVPRSTQQNAAAPTTPSPVSFSDFAPDLLDARILHTPAGAIPLPPTPTSPSTAPKTAAEEKEEQIARARVVFGSRLAGPGERKKAIDAQSVVVNGVKVPPRPEEPDNCCMSGCVNCVWDMYRDEIEEWAEATKEAKRKAKGVEGAAVSMDDDGGGSEGLWSKGSGGGGEAEEDLFEGIPVEILEFMKTEKRLKAKHAAEKKAKELKA